jgi:hypothetical protein
MERTNSSARPEFRLCRSTSRACRWPGGPRKPKLSSEREDGRSDSCTVGSVLLMSSSRTTRCAKVRFLSLVEIPPAKKRIVE